MTKVVSDHDRLDRRSLALHRLIATKLRSDPSLIDRARSNVRRWRAVAGHHARSLAEWESILEDSVESIVKLIVEPSERATRLRQSSPFTDILNEAEGREVYESYSARTRHPRRQRLIPLKVEEATGLCLDVNDLVLSKYVAGREKDLIFNQALIRAGCPVRRTLLSRVKHLPVDDATKVRVVDRIKADYAAANPRGRAKQRGPKGPTP